METIYSKRKEIDIIDKQIRNLLNQRFNLVGDIGHYKKKNQLEIKDNNREFSVIYNINSINSYYKKYITKVFNQIIQNANEIQCNIKINR